MKKLGYAAILLAMPAMMIAGWYTPALDRPPNILLSPELKSYGGTALIVGIFIAACVITFVLSSTGQKQAFHEMAVLPLATGLELAGLAANSSWHAKGAESLIKLFHALPLVCGVALFVTVTSLFLLKALRQPVVQ